MLQYGVFSTPERAEQAKGAAAVRYCGWGDLDEENRVYAGVSPDREQAKPPAISLKPKASNYT